MPALTIVAHIRARPDRIGLVRDELLKLIEITRAEDGCAQYDLHEDNKERGYFLFFENWESSEHWRAHMEAPHLKAFLAATEGAIADFSVSQMTRIG